MLRNRLTTASVPHFCPFFAPRCLIARCFEHSSAAAQTSPAPAPASSPQTQTTNLSSSSLRKIRVKKQTSNSDPAAISQLQKKISAEMAASGDCSSSSGPAEKRPLTALQKRQLAAKDKLVFSLAPNAVYRIKLLMDRYNKGAAKEGKSLAVGIRVGVQKRGCSGYSYTVNYALESDLAELEKKKAELKQQYGEVIPIDRLDTHVEQNGVNVLVDAGALFYVIGTKMDYAVTDVDEKFEFANPNKKSTCGCGDSFMPDM